MLTYFIACGDLVKIGKSRDPYTRLAQLQTASSTRLQLLLTIRGNWEADYHYMFHNFRRRGEWFEWNDTRTDLVYFIVKGRRRTPEDSLLDLEPTDGQRA